ncbi:MAG: peptidoglycan-associated lipoprotein Pal [Pseudomonadota bacterium]
MRLLAVLACILVLAGCARNTPEEPVLDSAVTGAGNASGPLAGSQAALQAAAGDTVYFAFDSSVVRPESQAVLRQQAAWLQQNPNVRVAIEGHTDERGTREYNIALGERRANAVRTYLIGLGVPASQMTTVSYGEERPASVGSGEQSWAANRRAVTSVLGTS